MPSVEPAAGDVRLQLQRVLAGAGFARNERLSRFLRFVVEKHLDGRDDELKESILGVEVFASPNYDPKQDSLVRTEAGRLRSRLAEYYAGEGSGDPVIIELPKGGYTPSFGLRRPDVVAEPAPRSAPDNPRAARLILAFAILAIVVGAGTWWWLHSQRQPIAIAVLPFENRSRDAANDDFTDGLTDEIIRSLSVIDGMEVRSRTSSFAFKGAPRNVREAGKQLGADYILEGSVLRNDQQLRIIAQLVRVGDDHPVWSGKFDRELTGIFQIQDELSLGIVNALRLQLGRGRRRYETSVEAYDLYLRARSELAPRRQIPLFEQAIAKDASFAPAWAGFASSAAFATNQPGSARVPEFLPKMRAAAEKAIQLDPLLAEAHHALALSYARDGQWNMAEQSFRKAIELDPNSAETYDSFNEWLLLVLGRTQEGLRMMYLAQKADPLSAMMRNNLGRALVAVGKYDEAAKVCLKPTGPNDMYKQCMARARLGQGRAAEAIQILHKEDGNDPNNRLLLGFLGYAYARNGQREDAERLASSSDYPITQALVFAGLSDKDRTLDALDRMSALVGPQRAGKFIHYPEFAFLAGDPRMKPFLKKIGLPQ